MNVSAADKSCLSCGLDYVTERHFVFERMVVRNSMTGAIYTTTIVHPCVKQYEEDEKLERITEKDILIARIKSGIESTTSFINKANKIKASKKKKK